MSNIMKFIISLVGTAVITILALPVPDINVPEWAYAVVSGVATVLVYWFPNRPAGTR